MQPLFRMRIIVNGDDLGMSEAANAAIFEGMRSGVITSATMLANGPAIDAAVRELHLFPQCSFGVHLNLTEFEPLCPTSRKDLASILDKNGCFNGNSIREVRIDRAMQRAIFREWCCQIDSLLRLGVSPSHFDAHHHVHTIPQILPVLGVLRKRYKIDCIRISRNMYENFQRPSRVLLAKKRLFNLALRAIGFRTTQIFTELRTFVNLCAERPPRQKSVELMTHPGALPRTQEASLLESNWPSRLSYKATLISYDSL